MFITVPLHLSLQMLQLAISLDANKPVSTILTVLPFILEKDHGKDANYTDTEPTIIIAEVKF